MSKILSKRERQRRKLLNKFKSFENKMHGENVIWWNSLSRESRYSLVFRWINFVSSKKSNNQTYKIKYFLSVYKQNYRPTKDNYRNSIIDNIIKK